MEKLGRDIWMQCIEPMLGLREICRLSQVCRYLHRLFSQHPLIRQWKHVIADDKRDRRKSMQKAAKLGERRVIDFLLPLVPKNSDALEWGLDGAFYGWHEEFMYYFYALGANNIRPCMLYYMSYRLKESATPEEIAEAALERGYEEMSMLIYKNRCSPEAKAREAEAKQAAQQDDDYWDCIKNANNVTTKQEGKESCEVL